MPEELASDVGAPGIARTKVRKRDSCSPLTGLAVSSDATRWLIDQGQPQAAQAAPLVDQHLRVLRGEAQPVQAGVEMDDGVERPVEALGGGAPGIELRQMVEDRDEPVLDEVGLGAGQQSVQHVDRRLGQDAAERDALVDMGHEEVPAALGRQPGAHHGGTGAVGIGLQDGGAVDRPAGRTAGIAQPAPVGRDCAQVDGKDRAGPSGRVVVGRKLTRRRP